MLVVVFFFNDTATTEIYTLSLHDALPICVQFWARRFTLPRSLRTGSRPVRPDRSGPALRNTSHSSGTGADLPRGDRKSTRLNSSHANISYAVFCLKKKKHSARPDYSTIPT